MIMKTIWGIMGIIIIGLIGGYSALIAQDEAAPVKPAPGVEDPVFPEVKPPSSDAKPNPNAVSFPFKIGVVNVAEVFEKYTKTKDYEKILQKEKDKEDLLRNEIVTKIKNLQEEMDVLSPSSDRYREKSEEVAKERARYEHKAKTWNEYIKNKFSEHALKIYKDIREAVNKYAVDNGYAFVFKSDPILSTIPPGEDVTDQINIRTVLYAFKETDITGDIIKMLNK
jgi:Skp family chaperone for outer membrane proteins